MKTLKNNWKTYLIVSLTVWLHGGVLTVDAETVLIDNFNDGNDDGWTHYTSGIFDASSFAYNLKSSQTLISSGWDGSSDPKFSEGFLRTKIRKETLGIGVALFMRATGGLGDYVVAGTTDDTFGIFRTDYGPPRTQHELVKLDKAEFFMDPNEYWWIEGGFVGNQITLKVWRDGELEPSLPQLTVTDSTYTTGVFGVAAVKSSIAPPPQISVFFDDIYFTFPSEVCPYDLVGDLNDDCVVNLYDVALLAGNYLIDCNDDPGNPNEPPCVLK